MNDFKKTVMSLFSIFKQTSQEELNQLTDLFSSLDEDHNGKLDKDEFRKLIQDSSIFDSSIKDVDALFDDIDLSHDGYLDVDEFMWATTKD